MSFQTYAVGYPVTFLIMLISSVLTGTLAAKLKTHAKLSAQLAFRTQILFDTDRLLQRENGDSWSCLYTVDSLIKPQYYSVYCEKWNFIRGETFLWGKRKFG